MLDTKARITIITPKAQQGAVMIVTLLFLVLITMIGVLAVKNSTTNLRLATSDQINTVLLQSADSANNKIEQSINSGPSTDAYQQIMSSTGIFGHFILGDNDEDIIDFCYRPRSTVFNINSAVIRRNDGKLVSNSSGYCDPSELTDYTSRRGTTMTQVMVKKSTSNNATRSFSHMIKGSDSEAKATQKHQFEIYSTAVLPAYGHADEDKVQACFQKDASSISDGVVDCMADNAIPSKMLVQKVDVINMKEASFCKKFGEANGSTSCPGTS